MHKVLVRKEDHMDANKKKIMIISVLLLVFIIVCSFFVLKKDSFEKSTIETLEALTSYELKGDMEIVKGEDVKTYSLNVGYLKEEKQDFFKVSITDKELNQTQNILRNESGVYVVTPSLNQIFKFEGNWPLNSLKPYLMQSMVEVLKDESAEIKKHEKHYFVCADVYYPNNSNFKKQEMKFDKDGKIQEVMIKDDKDVEQLKIVFHDVEYEKKWKKSDFEVPTKLKSEVNAEVINELDLPLYPMQIFDSALETSSSLEVAQGISHVLEYKGDKNFTIIEKMKKKSDDLETVIMQGDLVDCMDSFGFYDGNHMVMIAQGVEYTIYSDDLTPQEMADILSSMQVVVMK